MFAQVYSLMEDVKHCLQLAEKINSPTLRSAIVTGCRASLTEAADELQTPEAADPAPESPKPKRVYIIAKPPKGKAIRPNMPWAPTKTDLNAFRSELLIFLREAFPERNPKANMAEVAYLWTMSKDAGSLEDIIKCAKLAVTSASEGRLRSMSEEAV